MTCGACGFENLPVAHEDHAQRACYAALHLHEARWPWRASDANCDGRLGAGDIIRSVFLDGGPPQPYRCPLAAVNEDGVVDVGDRNTAIRLMFAD